MLEFIIFVNTMLLIFLAGYIYKLLSLKQRKLSHIDYGRALDMNGKPFIQKRKIIRI